MCGVRARGGACVRRGCSRQNVSGAPFRVPPRMADPPPRRRCPCRPSDIVGILVCVPIGFYGARYNKARVTAWGFVTSSVGVLMFALPMVALPAYAPVGATSAKGQLCSATNTSR